MTREQNPNLEILMDAVVQLGVLADEMVFVGGCATGLLITDAAAPSIRVTRLYNCCWYIPTSNTTYQTYCFWQFSGANNSNPM